MTALRIVCLALAAGILGLVGWRSAPGRPEPAVPMSGSLAALDDAMRAPPTGAGLASLAAPPKPAPQAAERPAAPAAEIPEFAGFYGRLKADFPRDYPVILERARGAGGADAAIWDALRDLEQSNGVLAAEAEPAALDRFFDARSAVLGSLAPLDARRCVDFLYGMTDASIADFTAAHRGLVATLADRTLDAIADGRLHHVRRTPPTAADLDELSAALGSFGLAPGEIGLLIDGVAPDPPLPDGRVCEIGRTYLDVLHGLPAEARQRIYGLAAELLARS